MSKTPSRQTPKKEITLIIIGHGDSIFQDENQSAEVDKNIANPASRGYPARTNIQFKAEADWEIDTIFRNVNDVLDANGKITKSSQLISADDRHTRLRLKIEEDGKTRLLKRLSELVKNMKDDKTETDKFVSRSVPDEVIELIGSGNVQKFLSSDDDYTNTTWLLNNVISKYRSRTHRKAMNALSILINSYEHAHVAYRRLPLFDRIFQFKKTDKSWSGIFFRINGGDSFDLPDGIVFDDTKQFYKLSPYIISTDETGKSHCSEEDEEDENCTVYLSNIIGTISQQVLGIKTFQQKNAPIVTAIEINCDFIPGIEDEIFEDRERRITASFNLSKNYSKKVRRSSTSSSSSKRQSNEKKYLEFKDQKVSAKSTRKSTPRQGTPLKQKLTKKAGTPRHHFAGIAEEEEPEEGLSERAPPKTPGKTPAKTLTKTPAKTPAKTPSQKHWRP